MLIALMNDAVPLEKSSYTTGKAWRSKRDAILCNPKIQIRAHDARINSAL